MPDRIDRAARIVPAPAQSVWDALVSEEALAEWLPPPGMDARFERFDPREGGGYVMVLTLHSPGGGKTTPDTDRVTVDYVEMRAPERIVQEAEFDSTDPALSGRMRMTWTLSPASVGTKVEIAAENVPHGITADEHILGLSASLENLARHVGAGGRPPL